MQYWLLKQTNPKYDAKLWRELSLLYKGGFDIAKHASTFLPKTELETSAAYYERTKCASYINYLGMIADSYTAELFEKEVVLAPAGDSEDAKSFGSKPLPDQFWSDFARNADLTGGDFVAVLREVFTDAVVKGKGLIACDFPRVASAPATRAEEDSSGASRAYCFELDAEALLDWECADVSTRIVDDANGVRVAFEVSQFSWCVTKRCIDARATPESPRIAGVEEYTVWRLAGGVATFETYRVAPLQGGQMPPDSADIPVASKGATSFKSIPIVEVKIPSGLWLGNKLGPMALEHFRRRSELLASQKKSLFSVPVIQLGPEIGETNGEQPSETQQDPNRAVSPEKALASKGYMVLGAGDKYGHLEPSGAGFKIVDEQLDKLVDEMFRVAHQMSASVSSTSNALGRSGASKALDRGATAKILSAYAAIVKDAAVRTYDMIAHARGETVAWVCHGLDDFNQEDRALLLQEAGEMKTVEVPSVTFMREWMTRVALGLVGNVSAETQGQIKKEIQAGVTEESVEPKETPALPPESSTEPPAPIADA